MDETPDEAPLGGGEPGKAPPAIQTVERAATILRSFSVASPRLSLNELTASLGATKATAHRYTKALRAANLVRYSETDSMYALGAQILTLSAAARAGMPVIAAGAPLMSELVREVNETVVLSIWDRDTAVIVHVDEKADRIFQVSLRTGARLDLTRSAQGRIFCAFLEPDDEPVVAAALAADPGLGDLVAEVRRTGLAFNDFRMTGVRSLATPVWQGDQLVAAMAVVGTTHSLMDDPEADQSKALRRVGEALSAEFTASNA